MIKKLTEKELNGRTWVALDDGDANFYNIGRTAEPTKWFARIQFNGELSIADQESFLQNMAAAPDLLASLKETLRALERHLDDDTNQHSIKHRDLLCPCNQEEVARAKAVIARVTES